MSLLAAIGQSWAIDGREAGQQAMQQALSHVGRMPVSLGWIISSHVDSLQQVLAGASEFVGDVALIGFSTSAVLTSSDRSKRSVAVGLLCGEGIQGRSNWWSDFSLDSRVCVQNMVQTMQPEEGEGRTLLVVADGKNGDAAYLCQELSGKNYMFAGCQAGGESWRGRTYQLGGRLAGSGGLAAAVLSGNVAVGVGAAHGWQPVGSMVRLSQVQGQWVRMLDERLPNETFSRLFGFTAQEWSSPPLSDMVRLYPFGLQEKTELVVRSPLGMEADGSLRMNANLPEGRTVDWMVGTRQGCLEASRQAGEQAMTGLGSARPKLAVVLVDAAWESIFELQPGAEFQPLRQIIGEDVPILGGYSFGQLARLEPLGEARLLNGHMLVILFGSNSE